MKKLFLTMLLILVTQLSLSQTVYSWTSGVDPGWVNVGALQWRPACSVVTTNCSGNYANNINSTYTSPIINTTCSNASTVNISFDIIGNAEYGYDFLFLEYSLDGGFTWVNPYGAGIGWTGNFPSVTNISNVVPSSNNFNFRFTFISDNTLRYSGYKLSNFKIMCNPMLPIELISFDGSNQSDYNLLTWSSASEHNNDYYLLERSTDGINWSVITNQKGAGNSTSQIDYSFRDFTYESGINYYRLSQIDFDGKSEMFKTIAINNAGKTKEVLYFTNLLGQIVNDDVRGLVIVYYTDGTNEKIYR